MREPAEEAASAWAPVGPRAGHGPLGGVVVLDLSG